MNERIPLDELKMQYRIVDHEKHASDILFEELKDNLKYCNNQVFFKYNNIWSSNTNDTRSYLMNYVMSSDIKIYDDKGNIKPFAQNFSIAKHITETIFNMVKEIKDDAFYTKFHTSTKCKLVFKDGVLDFISNEFYEWDSEYLIQNPVYSTLLINRYFKEYFDERTSKKVLENIEKVKKIIKDIFEEQNEKALHFLSRAYAGHYEDKDWGVFIGNRNCGKGVLDTLMKTSMEKYTATIPSGIFMYERNSIAGDEAKKMSWALDLQFVRLTTTQEINFDNGNKNIKINGVIIKKLASGGDLMLGRKNHQDETQFTIDTKLLIMCNDLPDITPIDTLETCIEFKTFKQFKSKKYIEERTKELNDLVYGDAKRDENILLELQKYHEADENIKDECNKDEIKNAFILLLLENYKSYKVPLKSTDFDDENEITLTTHILSNFKITENDNDKISYKELKDLYSVLELQDSYKKFKAELIGMGAKEYKDTKGNRGVKGVIKLI